MTAQRILQFASEADARTFERYADGRLRFNWPRGEVEATVVPEQPLPDDAVRFHVRLQLGDVTFSIARTECRETFMNANPEERVDMVTNAVRDLVLNRHLTRDQT